MKLNFSPQFFENWQTSSSFLFLIFEKRTEEGIKKSRESSFSIYLFLKFQNSLIAFQEMIIIF